MVDIALTSDHIVMILVMLIGWQTINIHNLVVRLARMDEQIKNILKNIKGE